MTARDQDLMAQRALDIVVQLQVIESRLAIDSRAEHQDRVRRLLDTVGRWPGVTLRLHATPPVMDAHGIRVVGEGGGLELLRAWALAAKDALRHAEARG